MIAADGSSLLLADNAGREEEVKGVGGGLWLHGYAGHRFQENNIDFEWRDSCWAREARGNREGTAPDTEWLCRTSSRLIWTRAMQHASS